MTPPPHPKQKKVDKSKKVWTRIDPALSPLAQMALGSISQKNLHNIFANWALEVSPTAPAIGNVRCGVGAAIVKNNVLHRD